MALFAALYLSFSSSPRIRSAPQEQIGGAIVRIKSVTPLAVYGTGLGPSPASSRLRTTAALLLSHRCRLSIPSPPRTSPPLSDVLSEELSDVLSEEREFDNTI
jgi:hypothetical protein